MMMHLYPLTPFRENKPGETGRLAKQFPESIVNKTIYNFIFAGGCYTHETTGEAKNGSLVLAPPDYFGYSNSQRHCNKKATYSNLLTITHQPAARYNNQIL
jgi:hypothetical protein